VVTVGLAAGSGMIFFPIPVLVLVSGFLIFAKTRWLKPVPWWVLAAMIGGLAAIASVVQTAQTTARRTGPFERCSSARCSRLSASGASSSCRHRPIYKCRPMSLSHDLEPARQAQLTGHDGDGVAPVLQLVDPVVADDYL
jgi:hypothetical protein